MFLSSTQSLFLGKGRRQPASACRLARWLSGGVVAAAPQQRAAGTPAVNLFGMAPSQLKDLFASLKQPPFRAQQVCDMMYGAPAVSSIDALTNLSKAERARLTDEFLLDRGSIEAEQVSSDGTRKWTVRLPAPADPSHRVECVFIPDAGAGPNDEDAGDDEGSGMEDEGPAGHGPVVRGTLCVSSQAGCSLACAFCHTGTQKLEGNLTPAGIYAQFALAQQRLASVRPHGLGIRDSASASARYRISNVVFMGQGEPLYNWRAVKGALALLTDARVGGLAPRRITVSTAGVAPLIPKLALETPDVRLAISLHAANDALRTRIMGINRTYPLADLMAACQRYLAARLAYVEAARRAGREANQAAAAASGRSRSGSGSGSSGGATPAAAAAAAAAAAGGSAARAMIDSDTPPDLRSLRRQHDMLADWHSSRWRSRITFEYVLLAGVNDSPAHADELRSLLASHLPVAACHVNLLPFHPWPGAPFEPSPPEAILQFQRRLQMPGLRAGMNAQAGSGAAAVDLRASVAGDARARAASEYGRNSLRSGSGGAGSGSGSGSSSYMPGQSRNAATVHGSGSRFPQAGASSSRSGGSGSGSGTHGGGAGAPGLQCHVRRSRGLDILGACGQLKSSETAKAAAPS